MVPTGRRRLGFTLVELLVVIGIIAILVAILVPSLSRARAQAQLVQCESNLRQFGLGFQMYCNNNNGLLPVDGPDGSNTTTNLIGPGNSSYPKLTGIDDNQLWYNAIPPMLGSKSYYQMLVDDHNGVNTLVATGDNNVFMCPSALYPATLSTKDTIINNYYVVNATDGEKQLTPSATTKIKVKMLMDFVLNSMPFGAPSPSPNAPNPIAVTTVKLTMMRPAARYVLMVEKLVNSGEYTDPGVQEWAEKDPGYTGKNITSKGYTNNIAQPKANWKRFTARHNGGGNLLFCDGHVQFYKWTDIQRQNLSQPVTNLPAPAPSGSPDLDMNIQNSEVAWTPFGWIN